MPRPQPCDWLDVHPESGQTFAGYVRSMPNQPGRKRHVVYLQPIGGMQAPHAPQVDRLKGFQARFFGIQVRVLPALDPTKLALKRRRNPGTGQIQLLTPSILDELEKRLPKDAYCVLGLTLTDLYPRDSWNFVFGQARLKRRVGVYSFARHFPRFYGAIEDGKTSALVLRRAAKLTAHETGHVYGMRHCIYYRCLMNGANDLTESDGAPPHLCPVCLRKLAWAGRLDVMQRYSQLRSWFSANGLPARARWIAHRERAIRKVAGAGR